MDSKFLPSLNYYKDVVLHRRSWNLNPKRVVLKAEQPFKNKKRIHEKWTGSFSGFAYDTLCREYRFK